MEADEGDRLGEHTANGEGAISEGVENCFQDAVVVETETYSYDSEDVKPVNGSGGSAVSESGESPPQCQEDERGDVDSSEEIRSEETIVENFFGDFDSAPVTSEIVEDKNEDIQECSDDDDFGDFDGAPASSEMLDQPEKKEDGNDGNVEEEDSDNDDFGDFNSTPTSSELMKAEMPPLEKKESIQIESGDEHDDFEDFDSAPVSSEIMKEEGMSAEKDAADDDFGGFDSAPASTDMQKQEESLTEKGEDIQEDDSDDDFGDFDSAPASSDMQKQGESLTEKDNGVEEDDSDDEDDFGDFDSTPASSGTSKPENVATIEDTGDDFGDFKESEDNTAAPVSSGAEEDTRILRRRSQVQALFARFSSTDMAHGDDDDDSKSGPAEESSPVSVRTLLEEQRKRHTTTDKDLESSILLHRKALQPIRRQEKGTVKKQDHRYIIADAVRGSYFDSFARFSFPVGDPSSFGATMETSVQKLDDTGAVIMSPGKITFHVPDCPPIQLSSKGNQSFNMTSVDNSEKKVIQEDKEGEEQPKTAQTVDNSTRTATAPAAGGTKKQSQAVKKILAQIPDISFMLSPRLETVPVPQGGEINEA